MSVVAHGSRATSSSARPVVAGLRENWRQFSLLVLVNAFVGAMVGLERTVLPLVAAEDFGLTSASAVLSFIATFGFTKALSNLAAGWSVERHGRRWTLVAGWIVALPVPMMILLAPSWSWIVAANALLGINQGLAWSTTVIMKIDLVGRRHRGLAMGLNEFAGYLAVAVAALMSGFVAARYGLRAGPAYLGLLIASTGLLVSVLMVRDTTAHARLEEQDTPGQPDIQGRMSRRWFAIRGVSSNPAMFSMRQAGFVNNLNDGVSWGLFPLLFMASGLSLRSTAALVAIYPATWGVFQVVFGGLSDRYGRKVFIAAGMFIQGFALVGMTVWQGFWAWMGALTALGIGTAMVYPTLLAAVADLSQPRTRAAEVSVYRLWRDLGYVAGAVGAGLLADLAGMSLAISAVGALTAVSGIVVMFRFRERPRAPAS